MAILQSTTFTKDDFKRASDLVEILGNKYDTQTIETAMRELLKSGAKIKINNQSRPIIYTAKWNHITKAGTRPALRLHPLGLKQFQEYLEKRK